MSLDLALEWAQAGHRVLPVNGTTKRPLIKAWQANCTTDETTIHGWWSQYPEARVGIATGEGGFDVLDFDVQDGKPGIIQLEKLLDSGVLAPGTFRVVETPSGGRHLYFKGSGQRNKQNEKAIPGVDFRGSGGMVLAAGNPGYRYITGRSIPEGDLAPIDWTAVEACLAPVEKPTPPPVRPVVVAQQTPSRTSGKLKAPPRGFDNAPDEESPLDWYCRQHRFEDVLFADGWQYAYSADGRDYWVRPGKKKADGVSANVMVNPDGRQTLVNYSSTVGWLPTDRGLSIAQYMAYRDHEGDVRAAARHIRTSLMPRRTALPAAPPANGRETARPDTPPVPAVGSVATPGSELVPVDQVGPPEPVRSFWQQRRELREVWYKSVIGGVSPWAVLGNILANVAGRIGPHVMLPPRGGVGKAASLNLLVGIMGNSGTGKGLSGPIAREFMGAPYPPQRKPGTGQGIAAMFTEQTKEGPVQSNDTVVLRVDEITGLGAHMSQQGATITSTLLEVYMAEELGEHYANKELRRPVKDSAYRLALVAGIQPGNSGILFDHAESGLPQRFLWMPAYWRDAVLPETDLRPPAPGSELPRWRVDQRLISASLDDVLLEAASQWAPSDAAKPARKEKEPEAVAVPIKDPLLVVYAPSVKREIDREHNRRLNALKRREMAGEDDPGDPDSHLLLTRAKVAACMAIWLDATWYVSDEMWALAGWVMWVSNDTRLKAQARLRAKSAEKTAVRAAAQVATQTAVREAASREHDALIIKLADRVRVVTASGWTVYKLISQGIAGRDKKAMREANLTLQDILDELVVTGAIEKREPEGAERGARYRARA